MTLSQMQASVSFNRDQLLRTIFVLPLMLHVHRMGGILLDELKARNINVLVVYRCSACRCTDREWFSTVPEQPLPAKTIERAWECLDVACSCHTVNGGKHIQAKIFDWTEVPY